MGSPQKRFIDNRPPQCDAADLNSYLNEINNSITGANLSVSDAIFNQLSDAIIKQALSATVYQVQGQDTYALNTKDSKDAPSALFDGMRVLFYLEQENTAKVTIDLNSYGAKPLTLPTGEELDAGAIVGFVEIVYNATKNRFELALQAGGGGAEGPGSNRLFYPSDKSLKEDYLLKGDKNWMMAGPLVVEAGKTLTLDADARLAVV